MKRKILVLIILILATCGCSVEYDLSIDDDNNYYEKVTLISEGNERYSNHLLYDMYLEEYPIYDSQEFLYNYPYTKLKEYTYYDKSITSNNYGYIATYKASFNNDSYKDSRMLLTSFKKADIGYNVASKIYYLELSNLKIFNADNDITKIKVNINVSNQYVVLVNNANSVNNNTYTWNFDSVNSSLILRYQDRDIYNESQKKEEDKKEDNNKENNNKKDKKLNKTAIIIIGIALLSYIALIIYIIMRKRKN